ncbi:MAG: hypothetical protein KC502_13650 [Myxococcales bacterium]|nr:hypothetical protein [Myxococcales bacterium]
MNHRCFVLINDLADQLQGDATLALAAAAQEEGVETWIVDVRGLSVWPDDRVRVRGVRLTGGTSPRSQLANERSIAVLRPHDVVWVRTNPPRDTGADTLHRHVPLVAEMAESQGIRVVNPARTLAVGWTKLMGSWLPQQLRPATLVTSDMETLLFWLRRREGTVVIKPATGSHGRGVFLIRPDDGANLVQQCEAVLAAGPAVAQDFVEWDGDGDVRVLVLDGAPVRIHGADAAVHRVPPPRGFRSNVHAGGTAQPISLSDSQRRTAEAAAMVLLSLGVRVAGLDLIGDKVIEVNVHAPGGLEDMSRFTGHDVTRTVARRLLRARDSTPA